MVFKILGLLLATSLLHPSHAQAIGFTLATAAGLTAATAAGGVGLTGVGLAVGAGLTGAAAFGGIKALGSLFKPPETPKLPSQAKPEDTSAKIKSDAEAAAKKDIDKRRRGIARNKTINTSPLGLTQADKSDLNLKTLTGT